MYYKTIMFFLALKSKGFQPLPALNLPLFPKQTCLAFKKIFLPLKSASVFDLYVLENIDIPSLKTHQKP